MWKIPLISLCYGCGELLRLDEEGGEQRGYCPRKVLLDNVNGKLFIGIRMSDCSAALTIREHVGIKIISRSFGCSNSASVSTVAYLLIICFIAQQMIGHIHSQH